MTDGLSPMQCGPIQVVPKPLSAQELARLIEIAANARHVGVQKMALLLLERELDPPLPLNAALPE